MATLWFGETNGPWRTVSLGRTPFWVAPLVGFVPVGDATQRGWAFLARAGTHARVNGSPVAAGLHILDDRDEIRVGSLPDIWFVNADCAEVAAYPGAVPSPCARCRGAIEPGSLSASCPVCCLWYHEDSLHPCWTYAPACQGCGHATGLSGGASWTPEGL